MPSQLFHIQETIARTDDKLTNLQALLNVLNIAIDTGEIVDKNMISSLLQCLFDLAENAQIILDEAAESVLSLGERQGGAA